MRRRVLTPRAQFWVSLPGASTEGNSPPNALKTELGEFMKVISCLICLQGADLKGLWQPCEKTIYLYLLLQILSENSFFQAIFLFYSSLFSLYSSPCIPCFVFVSFVWLVIMISRAQRIYLSYNGTYVHSTI